MNIVFIGAFLDMSGYATAARGYLKSLHHHIVEHNVNVNLYLHSLNHDIQDDDHHLEEERALVNKYEIKNLADSEYESLLEKEFMVILFQPPSYISHCKQWSNPRFLVASGPLVSSQLISRAKKTILAACWEGNKYPTLWKQILEENNVEHIIVPSRMNYDSFSPHVNCSLVPYVVDDISDSNRRSEKDKKKFTLLSLFQWSYRKAPDKLIKAFSMEFRDHEDVRLLIKSYIARALNSGHLDDQYKQLQDVISDHARRIPTAPSEKPPEVLLTVDVMSPQKINELYQDVDLFVLPSRGEGFGFPIAQSLMNKTPVLVCQEGGHIDFIDPEAAFCVKGSWEPIEDLLYRQGYHYNDNLYEPSLSSIRKQMRRAYNLWQTGKLEAMGAKGHKYLKKKGYDAASIGRKLFDVLKNEYETINS